MREIYFWCFALSLSSTSTKVEFPGWIACQGTARLQEGMRDNFLIVITSRFKENLLV